jgi:Lon protease-like protein
MKSPETNDVLSRALTAWRVAPPRNPRFRAAVWARLEAARMAVTWPGYARAHAAVLAGALALAVVAGGWVGTERAQARVAAERAEIVSAYVQSLDARAMTMP